jgi:hypothetical protein
MTYGKSYFEATLSFKLLASDDDIADAVAQLIANDVQRQMATVVVARVEKVTRA